SSGEVQSDLPVRSAGRGSRAGDVDEPRARLPPRSDVILAPWGETIVDARCFLRGGVCEATYGKKDRPYRTAGMQQAVRVMRRAGYRGPIAIPGLDYANDLSKWLSDRPLDPLHQLVAEAHVY